MARAYVARWQAVYRPTERRPNDRRKVIGSYKDREDAEECAYLCERDEPAPDRADYYSIRVEPLVVLCNT